MDTLNCVKQQRGGFFDDLRTAVEKRLSDRFPPRRLLAAITSRFTAVLSITMAASVAFAQVCSVPGRDGTGPTGGIVNTYYSPVIPTGTTLTTGASSIGLTAATGAVTALNPGDLVVVMQMQCATINVTNTSAYGDGTTTGRGYTNPASGCKVGTYEYVKAGPATTSSLLDLTGSPLTNTYIQDAGTVANRRTFQIIRVPQHSSLTLSGNVQSTYWNGSTGGVVILDVAGQLNWNGFTIDVLGRGFRGGAGIDQGFTADTDVFSDYVATNASDQHAFKGEGVAGTPRQVWDQSAGATLDNGATWGGYSSGDNGRGAPGNAGGGGDNRSAARDNGGGGGGGNGNIGGFGGLGWRGAGWTDAAAVTAGYPNVAQNDGVVFNLRGIGGGAIIRAGADADRMVMGGGGGAGAENNNSAGTTASGGAGGGIVMVRAGAISGIGSVFANGAAGQTQTGNDAGGGGGAGGSVLVWSNAVGGAVGTLTVNVSGGIGGDSFIGGTVAHAGGGGGAGGIVRSTGALAGTSSVAGGANGITNTGDLPAGASSAHGATGGGIGSAAIIATDPPGFEAGPRCLPALTVTKSTSTPTRTPTDTTANYSVVVTNAATGGTASGVNIVDDLPNPFTYIGTANVIVALSGGATGPAGPLTGTGTDPVTIGVAGGSAANSFTLPPGGSVTLSFPVALNGAAAGTYQNPAVANYLDPTRTAAGQTTSPGAAPASGGGITPGSNYSSASSTLEDVVIGGLPNLGLTKTATPSPFTVGQAASYTLTLTNTGTAATTAVATISDTIPTGLTIGTLPAGCTAVGQVVTCTVAAGLAATNGTASFVIPVTPTAAAGASVTNAATVRGGGDPGCAAATNPLPARCNPSITTTINSPALTITKTASAASFVVGTPASYTLSVQNTGTAATTAAATVTDTIPTGLTLGTLPAGCTAVGQVVTCTIAAGLAVSGTTSFVIPVTPTATAANPVVNTANVTGGGDPGCPAAARCGSTTNTPLNSPALTITKTASAASFVVGTPASYTLSVQNTGTAATTAAATVTDTIPTGLTIGTLPAGCTAVGQVVTCTIAAGLAVNATTSFVIPVTPTATAANPVVNTANVTGGGDPGCPAAARCGSTTNTPLNSPVLVVSKTASIARGLSGTTFTYTVTIGNTGSAASGNTVVTDTVPAGVTINSISAGFNWVCAPTPLIGPSTFSCTKASGVATGASNELVATLNATKTAVGTVVNTVNISSGDPGCSAVPTPVRCVSSAAVAGIPDMFPTFTPNFTTYNLNESRDVIININEINGVDSSGIIQFFVPNSAGFTYAYDLTRTSATILGDPYTVQNTDWTIQILANGKRFTSKPGVVIPAGGQSRIVMTCTADVAGTLASITVNITAGSGTEVRTNNNSVVLGQSVQE